MPIFRGKRLPPTLLEQIDAIPRTLLPDGPARDQLLHEAVTGGPLIDVYTKDAMTDDFTAGGPTSYVIERPLLGRSDSRWSPVEWRGWVEAGMPTTPCDFCGHPPAFLTIAEVHQADGSVATLCYPCHDAALGLHGMTKTPLITCAYCGRRDLQINPTQVACRACLLEGRHAR